MKTPIQWECVLFLATGKIIAIWRSWTVMLHCWLVVVAPEKVKSSETMIEKIKQNQWTSHESISFFEQQSYGKSNAINHPQYY